MTVLGEWICATILEQERKDDEARRIRKYAALTDDQLKALWNSPEGDDIHAELNRRGHGGYCAV